MKYNSTDNVHDKEVRKEIWKHASSRIALLTAFSSGRHNAMTVEWFTQIQFNPPRFLIALVKKYLTVTVIEQSKEFRLTFLAEDQSHISQLAGTISGKEIDKFAKIPLKYRDGKLIQARIVKGGVMNVECKVLDIIEHDYVIMFVGEVLYAEYTDEKSPLQYHLGEYHRLGEIIPKQSVENI